MAKRRIRNAAAPSGLAKIGDILPQVLARYGFHRQLEHDAIVQAWSETIGPFLPDSLKNVSQPGTVKRGTLEVRVQHAALVQELTFHQTEIVAQLNQKIPNSKIRKIRYIIDG